MRLRPWELELDWEGRGLGQGRGLGLGLVLGLGLGLGLGCGIRVVLWLGVIEGDRVSPLRECSKAGLARSVDWQGGGYDDGRDGRWTGVMLGPWLTNAGLDWLVVCLANGLWIGQVSA